MAAVYDAAVSSVLEGCIYGLVSMGLALIFGVTKIINFLHGYLIMIGAYIAYFSFVLLGLDPFASIPLVAATISIISLLVHEIFIGRLYKKAQFEDLTLLVTFGLALLIENVAIFLFTMDYRAIKPAYAGISLEILGVSISYTRLLVSFASVCSAVLFWIILIKTKLGKAIRAAAENINALETLGINSRLINAISFVVGSVIAGISGGLLASYYTINPTVGLQWSIKSFCVVILGGMGNLFGAFVGGIILGVSEGVASFVVGVQFRDAVSGILLIVILLFRPMGLFSKRRS